MKKYCLPEIKANIEGSRGSEVVHNEIRRCLNELYDNMPSEEATIYNKTITVEAPVADDDLAMLFTDEAITITQINDVVVGSGSVTWGILYDTSRAGTGTNLTGTNRVTSSTTGAETTTITNPNISVDNWLKLKVASTTGTITQITITIFYTKD